MKVRWLSNKICLTFQPSRRWRDRRSTVKQLFSEVSSNWKNFFLKSLNGHATEVGGHATVSRLQRFFDVSSDWKFFWKKSLNGHATVVGGHATVGRLSNNVFWTFQSIWENYEKSRWTVTRQWLRSRVRRRTVKQRILDVSSNLGKFWKKSMNGHATVVGGHATIGRLSNNVFQTFQAIRENFEKSRWTVTRQWSEVTRPSADCQTTFFRRFKKFGKILKKIAERSRNSGRRSRDRRPTVKQRFWMFQAIRIFFEKSHWTVTRQWSEVTRLSADCQTTFFGRFNQFENILKKVAERSRDSGRRSRDRRPTVKQRFLDVSSDLGKFWKKLLNGHATMVEVTRPSADCQTTFFGRFKQLAKFLKKVAERSRDSGRRSRDRRPTVKQRFLDVSSNKKTFWKKSLNGHAKVVGGHATVGRLSNNVFWTFQAIRNFFEKVLKRRKIVVWQSADGRVTSDHSRTASHTASQMYISFFFFFFFLSAKSLFTYLLLQEWSDPGNFDIISKLGIGRREFLILAGKFQLVDSPWGEQVPHYKHRRRSITYLLREIPVKNRERWDRSQQTGKLSG